MVQRVLSAICSTFVFSVLACLGGAGDASAAVAPDLSSAPVSTSSVTAVSAPSHAGGSDCACAGYVSNNNWSDAPQLGCSTCVNSGDVVIAWQMILWADGLANECDSTSKTKTGFDGQFGSLSASATKTWQTRHGLTADGIVGPNTWSKARAHLVNGGQASAGVYGYSYAGSAGHTVGYAWNNHFFNGTTPAWFPADPVGIVGSGDMLMDWYEIAGAQC